MDLEWNNTNEEFHGKVSIPPEMIKLKKVAAVHIPPEEEQTTPEGLRNRQNPPPSTIADHRYLKHRRTFYN